MKLSPHHPAYPRTLYELDLPPTLTVSRPLDASRRVLAIVGARGAPPAALDWVYLVAYHLARAGVVVVSGGATGVDRAAHEGALQAAGATWCVACCGKDHLFPEGNADLFERIARSASSCMIWPFPDDTEKNDETPRYRNGVLVALAEAVIVVQASLISGSRNSMSWARLLQRRLFLVPSVPWDDSYAGSMSEGSRGGKVEVVWSTEYLFSKLELPEPDLKDPLGVRSGRPPRAMPIRRLRKPRRSYSAAPLFEVNTASWSTDEKIVFSKVSNAPTQQEEIIEKTGLGASSTLTALLTLSLKDVVVEGPDGFYRRRIAT